MTEPAINEAILSREAKQESEPELGRMSLGQLMFRKFLQNRLAIIGGVVLITFFITILLAEFISPYNYANTYPDYIYCPPLLPNFIDQKGHFHLDPFVYGMESTLNTTTFTWMYKQDYSKIYPIRLFVHGDSYKLFGIIPSDFHLFGVDNPGKFFLFGTDSMGRDMLSRVIFGGRITISVGILGVILTIILGAILGTASGYYGGYIDTIMQRIVELFMSFPTVPLWAAFAALLPSDWDPIKRFFAISVILSLKNWTGLARQVRGKVLSYRELEYTQAARAVGASDARIIFVHMLPNAFSHIIVVATLSVPWMILGETALSFLGLGIVPPLTSWGAMLQEAQHVSVVLDHPTIMIPGIFIVITILAFNFVGDGLRDAADPFTV